MSNFDILHPEIMRNIIHLSTGKDDREDILSTPNFYIVPELRAYWLEKMRELCIDKGIKLIPNNFNNWCNLYLTLILDTIDKIAITLIENTTHTRIIVENEVHLGLRTNYFLGMLFKICEIPETTVGYDKIGTAFRSILIPDILFRNSVDLTNFIWRCVEYVDRDSYCFDYASTLPYIKENININNLLSIAASKSIRSRFVFVYYPKIIATFNVEPKSVLNLLLDVFNVEKDIYGIDWCHRSYGHILFSILEYEYTDVDGRFTCECINYAIFDLVKLIIETNRLYAIGYENVLEYLYKQKQTTSVTELIELMGQSIPLPLPERIPRPTEDQLEELRQMRIIIVDEPLENKYVRYSLPQSWMIVNRSSKRDGILYHFVDVNNMIRVTISGQWTDIQELNIQIPEELEKLKRCGPEPEWKSYDICDQNKF